MMPVSCVAEYQKLCLYGWTKPKRQFCCSQHYYLKIQGQCELTHMATHFKAVIFPEVLCVSEIGSPEGNIKWIPPSFSTSIFWDRVSHWSCCLPIQSDWLVRELLSPSLHLLIKSITTPNFYQTYVFIYFTGKALYWVFYLVPGLCSYHFPLYFKAIFKIFMYVSVFPAYYMCSW